MPQCQGHGVGSGPGAELGAGLLDIPRHRLGGQAELDGDLVVACALSHQGQDLRLAPGKTKLFACCPAGFLFRGQWLGHGCSIPSVSRYSACSTVKFAHGSLPGLTVSPVGPTRKHKASHLLLSGHRWLRQDQKINNRSNELVLCVRPTGRSIPRAGVEQTGSTAWQHLARPSRPNAVQGQDPYQSPGPLDARAGGSASPHCG